jgi:polyisoprenoid-binding protein YceI
VTRRLLLLAFAAGALPAGASGQTPAKPSAPSRYELTQGSEARFVVREQLAGATLPNDAVGTTTAISGAIVLDQSGKVDRAASRIVVTLDSLKSDQERRDRYIKRRTLVTDSFPTAELVPTLLQGFPEKLPASGSFTFSVLGDLTVHGVTKPTVWDVRASVSGGVISGRATTHLKFGDFGMTRPRVMVVLSVEDDIKLEFDFRFVPDTSP